jgi:hypothetical protein
VYLSKQNFKDCDFRWDLAGHFRAADSTPDFDVLYLYIKLFNTNYGRNTGSLTADISGYIERT